MLRWLLRSSPDRAAWPRGRAVPSALPARLAPAADDAWQRRLDAGARRRPRVAREIARSAPRLEHKLAAVDALAAKPRGRARVSQPRPQGASARPAQARGRRGAARETNARAERVIAAAQGLLAQSPIPANRLAEIDRE